MVRVLLSTLVFLSAATLSKAQLITGEEAKRQAQVLEKLKDALAVEKQVEAKFKLIGKSMKEEKSVSLRYKVLDLAASVNGLEIETLLTALLTSEADAGIRSRVATLLGQRGSEKSLGALVQCAEKDKTTDAEIGCMRGQSNARRSAIFAIAELTSRFPKLAGEAAANLRALQVNEDPKVRDNLVDAKNQALYQITHEEALIAPFFERLKSKEAKERVNGIVAFRYFKLAKAPHEVVKTLEDSSLEVRQWTALVLGDIGDPKTVDVLMTIANNAKEDIGVRCNAIYSIGRMKIPATGEQIEKLLMDTDQRVQTSAAIAFYRITGKKVKQFPEGYNAD
jgi:HEAT repeat protein